MCIYLDISEIVYSFDSKLFYMSYTGKKIHQAVIVGYEVFMEQLNQKAIVFYAWGFATMVIRRNT